MFVYRHFSKWGIGVGLLPFLCIILPLMLVWAIARAVLMAVGEVAIVSARVIAWAWHKGHRPPAEPPGASPPTE